MSGEEGDQIVISDGEEGDQVTTSGEEGKGI